MTSNIEWLIDPEGRKGETWNPIRARITDPLTGEVRQGWHCEIVSPGCVNCYAQQQNKGFFKLGTGLPYNRKSRDKVEIYLDEETLLQPLRWKKARRIFPCSMTDWMGEWVPDEWIDKMLAVAALCPQHTFLFLTKRTERLPVFFANARNRIANIARVNGLRLLKNIEFIQQSELMPWPLPNVWIGISCEDQKTADERTRHLYQTPAAMWWLSLEPMIGPINMRLSGKPCTCAGTCKGQVGLGDDWRCVLLEGRKPGHVVLGGESGPHARPFDLQWARDIIGQCKAAQVPVFVKQLGAKPFLHWDDQTCAVGLTLGPPNENQDYPVRLKNKKGGDMNEWSADLRIREYPQ